MDIASECELTGAARARARSDAAVLLAGCVWRLYQLTIAHAQVRRMFRRNLADFPVIRLRLAVVLIHVIRTGEAAQCIAVRTAGENDYPGVPHGYAGALRLAAESVRIETQQLCGGSGYMRESAYAQALAWYEWCDGGFRRCGLDAQELTTEQAAHIDDAVRARLMTAGFLATQVDLLLCQASGDEFGRAWRAA